MPTSAAKDQQIERLVTSAGLDLATITRLLSRDELKQACRAHGLDDAGRSRTELTTRLLGRPFSAGDVSAPIFGRGSRGAVGDLPEPGDIVQVRHRQYLVEEVDARPMLGEATRVGLVCLDDDNQGRRLDVLWELELGARVFQPETHGLGDVRALDAPERFASYLHALRWHAVTATETRLFQAPFRAGIQLMNHQLTPLKKALELPRANLFIADDVGLGKTIEAGLVLQELLLRQQVELVLIVAPASVCLQWRDEMQRRFGLHFEIYNRAFMARRRQERGFGVNPWTTHARFIISYQTLRRPEYRDPLLARLDERARKSLLILDEAHTAAPASASKYAIDSRITKVVRDLAPRFDNRLFLTGDQVLDNNPATRARWLQETTGMTKGQAEKLNKALTGAKTAGQALDVLDEHAAAGEPRRAAGRLVVQPGPERRRTSSHYTPRRLTAPIVQKTLEPLFRAMGEKPPSEQILNLKICDPAMGSGAFLVEACRFLADQVVLAWTREGRHDRLAGKEDATLLARRLVAQRCLYGADKNAYAVHLAKLSLWLVTLARDLPFTFVDHALRHGDSLVGLSLDQITRFHWKPSQQLELCQKELESTLNEAISARERILDLASDGSPAAQKEKEWLLGDAEDALDRVRLVGDLVVGAFFAADGDKEREQERERRLDLVLEWLRSGQPPSEQLVRMREEIRRRFPVFHWMAEYPEVFWVNRKDPLNSYETEGRAWMDAFVGNPPFMGVAFVTEQLGEGYVAWLQQLHDGTTGKFDVVAHFFRRANELLGDRGTIGLIATNTVAQGDTRATGLQRLLRDRLVIYDATRSMTWPGEAAVTVAMVHIAKGLTGAEGPITRELDRVRVVAINSRLRAGVERPDPVALQSNDGLIFQGSIVLGMGFVLSSDERDALVKKDRKNAERIFAYLGGEEVNTSPTQDFERYVINFGEMSAEQAAKWPDLFSRLRETVKPERERTRESRAYPWWQFWRQRAELYSSIGALTRCLVISRHSKHLAFAFQPCDRIFSEATNVLPIDQWGPFATLQSRIHEVWARLLSSTMKTDMRYAASDCFETFPFPQRDPRALIPALEDVGQRLYERRAAYMVGTQQGITQTYNHLKNPECHDPETLALRELHLEIDCAVLTAYGWTDLVQAVTPYTTPQTEAEKQAYSAFEDAVIDRLFALNAERAEQERLTGASASPAGKAARKPARRAAATAPTAQATLPILLPFTRAPNPKPSDKFTRCIPLENLRIAAGGFSEHQEREVVDWVVPSASIPLARGMFVAQVTGRSMEPLIPDGAYCVFQRPWLKPAPGQDGVFVGLEEADPDLAARATVKRYSPRWSMRDGERQLGGTLDPLNPDFRPLPITEDVRPYARLIAVLPGRPE